MKDTYVVIPALEPPQKFYDYLRELTAVEQIKVIVIDDGSGEAYRPFFQSVEAFDNCVVLTHPENKGKGQALKTAFTYLEKLKLHENSIVCADCDGQHTIKDILRMAEEVQEHPGSMVLGERQFDREDIPWKSRFGNRVSSFFFWLSGGLWVKDTQTGLRAFDESLLPFLLEVPGERFEYEMQALKCCLEQHVPIHMIDIETIYENENQGTHFHPIKDSIRVMSVLFRQLASFLLSSFGSAVFDLALFFIFLHGVYRILGVPQAFIIAASTVTARIGSIGLNYYLNRHFVFRAKKKQDQTRIGRYLCLCVFIMLSSAALVTFFCQKLHSPAGITKIIVDSLLFVVSYQAQKRWVFREKGKTDEV